jgi:hypothetical protein
MRSLAQWPLSQHADPCCDGKRKQWLHSETTIRCVVVVVVVVVVFS